MLLGMEKALTAVSEPSIHFQTHPWISGTAVPSAFETGVTASKRKSLRGQTSSCCRSEGTLGRTRCHSCWHTLEGEQARGANEGIGEALLALDQGLALSFSPERSRVEVGCDTQQITEQSVSLER